MNSADGIMTRRKGTTLFIIEQSAGALFDSVVEYDAKKRIMDFQLSVVVDETQLPELV